MSAPDSIRLSKTMAFLLRHRPDVGGLVPDADGWVSFDELSKAVVKLLRVDITPEQLLAIVGDARIQRFEVVEGRIRALAREEERRDAEARRTQTPDILYHATTADQVPRILATGALEAGPSRHVFLSADEANAWRVAHRMNGAPRVLYIDAARARRRGVKFLRNRRNGLYLAASVPLQDVLNLQPGFAEQISAGGIPIVDGPEGPQMALIRVTRRSGVTWEVAKGKLEPGEPPEQAAVREVQEEMGVQVDLSITRYLGLVRYGFLAPGGLPRLKSVHLFLMQPAATIESFLPAAQEGIGAVKWFSLPEACKVVTHSSLVPLIRRAAALLGPDGIEEFMSARTATREYL